MSAACGSDAGGSRLAPSDWKNTYVCASCRSKSRANNAAAERSWLRGRSRSACATRPAQRYWMTASVISRMDRSEETARSRREPYRCMTVHYYSNMMRGVFLEETVGKVGLAASNGRAGIPYEDPT